MIKNKNNGKSKVGFTLVELLAVIVVLAIILVIAVPKIMSTIEDARKGSFESTAKLIASQAERKALENETLGITGEIKCEDVAKLSDNDYETCKVSIENGVASVTIVGKGKFNGMYVCNATKTSAEAIKEECPLPTVVELLTTKVGTGGLQQTSATYINASNESVTVDAGIRYAGSLDSVANKVYFNCELIDSNNVAYGSDAYDYANSCETWRIIGVFDVEDGSGNIEKKAKLINTESTFNAAYDSSTHAVNIGKGVNQWGASSFADGSSYAGADLMQLLNGYYIGESTTCTYCNTSNQETCSQTCDATSLTTAKMKPLTTQAKSMIEDAVWYTYGVDYNLYPITSSNASAAYLQERGITAQYTGKGECESSGGSNCNDTVNRKPMWLGLVGLMSVSDVTFANGWLYPSSETVWSITPSRGAAEYIWWVSSNEVMNWFVEMGNRGVWPSVYLKADVEIIGGDGLNTPYKLSL